MAKSWPAEWYAAERQLSWHIRTRNLVEALALIGRVDVVARTCDVPGPERGAAGAAADDAELPPPATTRAEAEARLCQKAMALHDRNARALKDWAATVKAEAERLARLAPAVQAQQRPDARWLNRQG